MRPGERVSEAEGKLHLEQLGHRSQWQANTELASANF
jgi:hypothetical protein